MMREDAGSAKPRTASERPVKTAGPPLVRIPVATYADAGAARLPVAPRSRARILALLPAAGDPVVLPVDEVLIHPPLAFLERIP